MASRRYNEDTMNTAIIIAMLLLTNADRATVPHLQPLVYSADISQRAQSRAQYLCTHPFSHGTYGTPSEWTNWMQGISGYIGENLAEGFPDATSTNAALMASPEHRDNILDVHYSRIGIGNACGVTVEEFAS